MSLEFLLAGNVWMGSTRYLSEMVSSGVQPNYVTVITSLALCACDVNLQHGWELSFTPTLLSMGLKGIACCGTLLLTCNPSQASSLQPTCL
uniref:Pentatricopeptide repeat-containing protein n=2 Tax=Aegilops tauschii subsp. strangulata TaxID=200361 RepID=A0A453SY10_AEGTS